MSEDSSNLPLAERALQTILAEVARGTLRLYRNLLGQPYFFADHPDFPAIHEHLRDQSVRVWLAFFLWQRDAITLRPADYSRIMPVLEGKAMSEPVSRVTDAALLQKIEQEPVLLVVSEFMYTRKRHEARAGPLYEQLREFARGRGMLVRGKKRFPGGPNVLTRKLTEFKCTFELLEIDVEVKRSDGAHVTLTNTADDSTSKPSAESSEGKPKGRKELEPQDARKTIVDKLAAKRTKGNENENERKKS